MGIPSSPVEWFKLLGAAMKWPARTMVCIFITSLVFLSPLGAKILPNPQWQKWMPSVALFSGIWLVVAVLHAVFMLGAKHSKEWRASWLMDRKIRGLQPDELQLIIGYYFSQGTTSAILDEPSSIIWSLMNKGILMKGIGRAGDWIEEYIFDLTPRANMSLRKKNIQRWLAANANVPTAER